MLAPVIVQTLGCGIEVAVKTPEQHRRQTQGLISAGRQATLELPIAETTEHCCAIRARLDPQSPVAGPEDLAQIGRGFRAERRIWLESKAGLAGPAFQHERCSAVAMPDLCFLGPRALQTAHVIDRFVNAVPEGERRCYIDVRPGTTMMYRCVSAQESGRGVELKQEFCLEWSLDPGQRDPQSQRIGPVPDRNPPGHRPALGSPQDHCGSFEWPSPGRRRRFFADIFTGSIARAVAIDDNGRTIQPDGVTIGGPEQIPGTPDEAMR